ncbi:uncharacterized protein LOC132298622 [Cornus florida]|uniref:uncharacterized protein LOC132298622 n=1 Tax=Cornus florida TaxID=4283 RepID=UPI00289E93CA|nr:uncharacterized protein LOC132298622 [Cornus florida]
MKPFCFFSLFLFSFFTFHVITTSSINPNIQETCNICAKDDPNPKAMLSFCTNVLQGAKKSEHASRRGLGKISMTLLKANMNGTKFFIRETLNQTKLDPNLKLCLKSCRVEYKRMKLGVDLALQDYKFEHYQDAHNEISGIMNAPTTCENLFKEKKISSPLTQRNEHALQLSTMALCYIDKVVKK